MVKLAVTIDQHARRELLIRAERLAPKGSPYLPTPLERNIHFLRGVSSRATMTLPAFYLFWAANAGKDKPGLIQGYAGIVFRHSVYYTSIGAIALACRKIFDHGAKGLTGAGFAKSTDAVLEQHAEYWANTSRRPISEAYAALHLLRSIFNECSRADKDLLGTEIPLCQRIGALKQYANHAAAHLTLESFSVSILDYVHVVAALTLIGEIVMSFDAPEADSAYFDNLDIAAFSAAIELFPDVSGIRLFHQIQVEMQARLCWQRGEEHGREMLLVQIPYATGWW